MLHTVLSLSRAPSCVKLDKAGQTKLWHGILRYITTPRKSSDVIQTHILFEVYSRYIRASVDALSRDGPGQISRERATRPSYPPGNNKLSLKNTPLGSTDPPIP